MDPWPSVLMLTIDDLPRELFNVIVIGIDSDGSISLAPGLIISMHTSILLLENS